LPTTAIEEAGSTKAIVEESAVGAETNIATSTPMEDSTPVDEARRDKKLPKDIAKIGRRLSARIQGFVSPRKDKTPKAEEVKPADETSPIAEPVRSETLDSQPVKATEDVDAVATLVPEPIPAVELNPQINATAVTELPTTTETKPTAA